MFCIVFFNALTIVNNHNQQRANVAHKNRIRNDQLELETLSHTCHFVRPELICKCYMRNDNVVIVEAIEIEQFLVACINPKFIKIDFVTASSSVFIYSLYSFFFVIHLQNFSICTFPSNRIYELFNNNKLVERKKERKTSVCFRVNLIGVYVYNVHLM